MHKREVFKEMIHFEQFIAYGKSVLPKYEMKMQDPHISEFQILSLRYAFFRQKLHLLIARYSLGEDIGSLRMDFIKVIDSFIQCYQEERSEGMDFRRIDDYVRSLWMVSLSILFDVPDEEICRIIDVIDQNGKDAVFEKLVGLRLKRNSDITKLIHPNPYKYLYQAMVNKDDCTKNIVKFLQEYYKGMKRTYWYNTHLESDLQFFGYWCFELAAFVKCLHIDDLAFANNIFYPRDLVGRYFLRTWEDSELGVSDRALYNVLMKKS